MKYHSELREVECVYNILLSFFLQNLPEHYEEIIPIAIVNLVLLEAIPIETIVFAIYKVSKSGKSIKSGLCLFRMHFIFEWIL